jgi:hypothetical protein
MSARCSTFDRGTRRAAALSGALAIALGIGATMQAADERKPPVVHQLPDDPKAVVIVLDYQGGFTPPRQNQDAHLTIRADGSVITGAPWGQRKRIEARLTMVELHELLNYILDEQKLSEFDADHVQRQVRDIQQQRGTFLAIADAPTTVVTVHADGKTWVARYYALTMAARQFPEVMPLQRLMAVERRLQGVYNRLHAGGPDALKRYLELANAALRAKDPQLRPLSADDLQSATSLANGQVQLSFARQEPAGQNQTRYVSVQIRDAGDGTEPTVNANVNVVATPNR